MQTSERACSTHPLSWKEGYVSTDPTTSKFNFEDVAGVQMRLHHYALTSCCRDCVLPVPERKWPPSSLRAIWLTVDS